MALIHEELYKHKQLETLEFSAYIRKLVKKLFQTYILNSKNIHSAYGPGRNLSLNMDEIPFGNNYSY